MSCGYRPSNDPLDYWVAYQAGYVRQVGTDAFKTAVMLHFAAEYAARGQTAMVTV